MKKYLETQTTEYKSSWRDEWLKWICAFANSQGGTLYIGIDDKAHKVIGVNNPQKLLEDIPEKIISSMGIVPDVRLEEREDKHVIAITVKQTSYPVSYHGEFHIRCGATKQLLTGPALTQFILDRTGLKWDGIPLDGVNVEDLDRESFRLFRKHAIESGRMTTEQAAVSDKRLLENLGLFRNGKLTRAAVMLFHPTPERWVCTCYSKIGMFTDEADLLFQDEIRGSLLIQAERLIELLFLKYLIAPVSYHGFIRVETYPYSQTAVRELVYNALIHQDFIHGTPVQLSVRPSELRLCNAGGLPEKWTVKKLLGKHTSKPRNKLIANAFYRAGFIEKWGRGIEKVTKECERIGAPHVEYDVTPGDVMAILKPLNVLTNTIEQTLPCKDTPTADTSKADTSKVDTTPVDTTPVDTTPVDTTPVDTTPVDTTPFDTTPVDTTEISITEANTTQISTAIKRLLLLDFGCAKAKELRVALHIKQKEDFRIRYLRPVLQLGLLETTQPHALRSPNQKYCLTAKGKKVQGILRNKSTIQK